jgi:hypothetical protein
MMPYFFMPMNYWPMQNNIYFWLRIFLIFLKTLKFSNWLAKTQILTVTNNIFKLFYSNCFVS